ncbi:hypothetical protein D9M68_692010 [compost metagenome]
MELVELQVAHPAAGAPGHGDAVAAGAVGIAGIEVDLGRAAGGEHGEARPVGIHFSAGAVEYVGAQAALAFQAELALGDQVDGDPLLQQQDVRPLPGLLQQGIEDGCASGVGGMDDAPVAVAALAGEMELETAILARVLVIAGEGHALVDQPLDGCTAMLNGEAYGVFPAQAGPGDQGVFDMGIDRVGVVQHRGHAALGPIGRTIAEVGLAQHHDIEVRGQGEGQGQASGAAADDQYVLLEMLAHIGSREKSGG